MNESFAIYMFIWKSKLKTTPKSFTNFDWLRKRKKKKKRENTLDLDPEVLCVFPLVPSNLIFGILCHKILTIYETRIELLKKKVNNSMNFPTYFFFFFRSQAFYLLYLPISLKR